MAESGRLLGLDEMLVAGDVRSRVCELHPF